jgi:DNA polymerase elongation subunit (family B)
MNRQDILKQKMVEIGTNNPFDPKLGYVTDPEEIRKMCLYENKGKYDLDLIHPSLEFYGLYPEIMKTFEISPEMLKMMNDIYEERKDMRTQINMIKNSTYGAFGKNPCDEQTKK